MADKYTAIVDAFEADDGTTFVRTITVDTDSTPGEEGTATLEDTVKKSDE